MSVAGAPQAERAATPHQGAQLVDTGVDTERTRVHSPGVGAVRRAAGSRSGGARGKRHRRPGNSRGRRFWGRTKSMAEVTLDLATVWDQIRERLATSLSPQQNAMLNL